MTNREQTTRQIGDVSRRLSLALALVMAGASAWAGIHERLSVPDFEKNEAQYLAERRPTALAASMRDQFETFQSQFNDHSFDKQGGMILTLDPNSAATQADVQKRAT